jgi:Ca-activated chloride channel homolog
VIPIFAEVSMKSSLVLALLFLCTAVNAQEAVPPAVLVQIDGKSEPIELTRVAAEVRILGALAETRMTMTFRNPHSRALEGELYFPLPEGSTISGYALDIRGAMVDGVAVTKEKARQTFEKEVRKGIDPGIVEWTRGNNFKARIFPLPAKGTRTVMVSYLSETVDTPEGALYQLPLNFREKVGEFSLKVELVRASAAPKLAAHDLSNFSFSRWNEGFRAETTLRDAVLTKPLSITLPNVEHLPVVLERDAKGVVRFVVSERVQAPEMGRTAAPERLSILWDASGSRGTMDHTLELTFLRRYFETVLETRPATPATLTVFRDRAEPPVELTISAETVDEVIGMLFQISYDGGTSLAAVTPEKDTPKPDLILLFSDGLSTFGPSDPGTLAAPVYAINSSSVADAAFLGALARRTGGRSYNLNRTSIEAAVAGIGRPAFSFLSATTSGSTVAETYPSMPEPVNGRFLLTGVLKGEKAEITLHFGVNQPSSEKTLTLKASEAVEGDTLRRFWAQKKLADLLVDKKRNEREITELGRRHGLVTPFTSLIVLESLEQYIEHEILPPATLPELREKYIAFVETRRQKTAELEQSKLERMVTLWRQRVEWWETEFTYPENFRYRAEAEKKLETSDAMPGNDAGSGAPSPSSPRPPGGAVATPRGAGGGLRRGDSESLDKDGKEDEAASAPAIALKGWDPKTPYLKALKAAPAEKRYATYLAEKKTFGNSPAFYLDCADFFLRETEEQLGIRILSNIAEMELENASLLRILGHRLAQLGRLDLAVLVFEEALKLRPEEPQSHRDLGLVLAKRGSVADLERAIDLLYHVVLNKWDRFEEIELLTLMELNQVIPKARVAGVKDIPVDGRLVKPLDLDVRIVMTWDADLTDMDLHVIEASREEAYYGHNRTTIGGLVSRDFTQGYGPEEYLLRKAMHGRYIIKTKFYGSSAAKLIGAVTLHVDVYTNYGRHNQAVKSMTLRLTGEKEMFTVGEIEF